MPDRLTAEQRSRLMSRIRSKWTLPEVIFQKRHPSAKRGDWLPFKPDFLFKRNAIFIDSDFWHGWVSLRTYSGMPSFWREKLFRNIIRDSCRDAFWEVVKFRE